MNINFNDKVVVVTGSARGIGKVIASQFAAAGAKIVIVDMDEEQGLKVSKGLNEKGHSAEFCKLNLENTDDIESFVKTRFSFQGGIDVLINNARGRSAAVPLGESTGSWDSVIDISTKAPLFLSQSLINSAAKTEKQLSIVNISSIAASLVGAESAAYHASKAGLESLTKYLAVYGGSKNIRVNAIRPGFIVQDEHLERYLSSENKGYREKVEYSHPIGACGTANDVAKAAMFLASDFASFITGQVLAVDGGLSIQDQWNLIYNSDQWGKNEPKLKE